jgi:hypothetical protein
MKRIVGSCGRKPGQIHRVGAAQGQGLVARDFEQAGDLIVCNEFGDDAAGIGQAIGLHGRQSDARIE